MTQNRDVIRRRYMESVITGLLANPVGDILKENPHALAKTCATIADAMLEEEDKYCNGRRIDDR